MGVSATTAAAMTVNTEKLSVTIDDQAVAGDNATYTGLWVGEVDRNGKTVTWVELTDRFGEVVYEGAIRANETHLLPDGHALIVRSRLDEPKQTVKMYTDRVAPDAHRVATQRIVVDPLKAAPKEPRRAVGSDTSEPSAGILEMARHYIGDAVRVMKATVRSVRIAWL